MRERINELRSDSRAVSPVIGVVLMIAVVVILAAVVGAFATGVFGNQQSAPQASFSLEQTNSGGYQLVFESGDTLDKDNLEVAAGGQTTSAGSGDLSAGGTLSVPAPGSGLSSGDTVRVVWNNPSGDSSSTIFETTI